MPAPVSSNVLPAGRPGGVLDFASSELGLGDGDRKHVRASTAPAVVAAVAGRMRGFGNGSVNGMRISGISPGHASTHRGSASGGVDEMNGNS